MPPLLPPNVTPQPEVDAAEPKEASVAQELAPEDFYYEGPYLVFTAAYHLKRGRCCNSGCRHCPYGDFI
jgi:hypothetical protein